MKVLEGSLQEVVMKKVYAVPTLVLSGNAVADTLGPTLPNVDSPSSGIASVGTVGFNL